MEQKFLDLFKTTLEMEGENVNLDDDFRSFEEWDSLALLSVIAMLDEEYGIVIDSEEFQKLTTIRDIYKHINSTK